MLVVFVVILLRIFKAHLKGTVGSWHTLLAIYGCDNISIGVSKCSKYANEVLDSVHSDWYSNTVFALLVSSGNIVWEHNQSFSL